MAKQNIPYPFVFDELEGLALQLGLLDKDSRVGGETCEGEVDVVVDLENLAHGTRFFELLDGALLDTENDAVVSADADKAADELPAERRWTGRPALQRVADGLFPPVVETVGVLVVDGQVGGWGLAHDEGV